MTPSHPQPPPHSVQSDAVQGDKLQGDKVQGDKVLGDKITVYVEGKRVTLPARPDLLAYLTAIGQVVDFARWADRPETDAETLYEQSDGVAPDTFMPLDARPLPTRVAAFRPQPQETSAHEVVETLLVAPRTVILGEPGSGKSSALQRLTWVLADRTLAAESATSTDEANLTLPIFARLADYQGESDLLPLLRRALNRLGALVIDDEASLRHLLRARNVRPVLLLDGLNELAADLHQAGLRCLRNHLADYPGHAVHITCRTADFDVATQTLPGAPIWVVQPLTDEIRYWGDEQGQSDVRTYLRRHLGESRGKRLYERLRGDERLHSLARLPLFLWMFKETAGSSAGELPVDRGGLVRSFVEHVVQGKIEKHLQVPAEQGLQRLAWRWQQAGQLEGNESDLDALLADLPNAQRYPPASVRAALQESGLLIDLGRSRLKLLHQLVQEYAAAAHLTQEPTCAAQLPALAQQEAWRECVILALWLRADLHTPDFLLTLMTTPAIDLRMRVEAARILGQVGDPRLAPQTGRQGDKETRGKASSRPASFIEPVLIPIPAGSAVLGGEDEDAYDDELPQCVVPVAAFELAAHPVTNAEFRCFLEAGGYEEPSLWTPGGQAWLRGEGQLDAETEQNLRQQYQYVSKDVEGWIAQMKREQAFTDELADNWRWIVTLSEDRFVELYAQQILGEQRRQPYYWEESNFNRPNQPVVGVNWYEALAYATWLSQLTGHSYTLPSEAQWEWAARRQGDKVTGRQGDSVNRKSKIGNRKYPWGNEWDADKCNWSGSRLNQPAPIGLFPHGATPDGLHDLAGNVYEWTRSLYRPYPYVADDGREDLTVDGIRVIRGGSWYTDRRRVRCAYRGWLSPRDGIFNLGYRLARTSLV